MEAWIKRLQDRRRLRELRGGKEADEELETDGDGRTVNKLWMNE